MKKKTLIVLAMIMTIALSLVLLSSCGGGVDHISKPTNIKYDGARITWSPVALAEYYTVSINGGTEQRVNNTMYVYDSKGVSFNVTVNAYFREKGYPETKEFTCLPKISNIVVDNSGRMSWDPVYGAAAYRIMVNGEILPKNVTDTSYQVTSGNNRVKIMPIVPSNDSFFSTWSDEKVVNIMEAPHNLSYNGKFISWNGTAEKYLLKIGSAEHIVEQNSFEYNSGNKDFDVVVMALGDYTTTFDSASVKESYYYLAQVQNIVIEDGILKWDAVQGAEGYKIKSNGVEQDRVITTNSYDNIPMDRSLAIEIKPIHSGNNYFSDWSVTKNIFILNTPVIKWESDIAANGHANNNLIWEACKSAGGYRVKIVNPANIESIVENSSTVLSYANAYSEIGTYCVSVQAIAKGAEGVYSSRYSEPIEVTRLPAPELVNVTSDANTNSKGFTINYQPVIGATGYQLYKDGSKIAGKISVNNSISDTSLVNNGTITAQTYNYSIKSVGKAITQEANKQSVVLDSLRELSVEIKVQAAPTNFHIDGTNVMWDAVSSTSEYAIKVDDVPAHAANTQFDLSGIEAGNHDVAVCAKGNGAAVLASNYTPSIAIKRLEAPTNLSVSYAESNGKLTWKDVPNAKGYNVYINKDAQAIESQAIDNIGQYITEQGTNIHMVANANYMGDGIYYMSSAPSEIYTFIKLATPVFPESALYNSNELIWNAPDNINAQDYSPRYEVYESGIMQTGGTQNDTRYNISNLEGGHEYTFTIKAIGNDTKYLNSEMSQPISVYKLATPIIRYEAGKYCWDSVANATNYVLTIDGNVVNTEYHQSGSQYEFVPTFTSVGKHTVALKAIGDKNRNIDSNESTLVQEVRASSRPKISSTYSQDVFAPTATIDVKVETPSDHTALYKYEVAGHTETSAELTYSYSVEGPGVYNVAVSAVGCIFDEAGVYYIESTKDGGNSTTLITILAAPTHNSIRFNSDGIFSWSRVNKSYGYDYQIAYDNQEYGEITHVAYASATAIPDFKQYEKIKIRIRAKGDLASKVVTSDWVEYIWNNTSFIG